MPGGRGNKAIELLDPALRAKIDALIYLGTPVTEIYDQYPQVQAAMQLRTLQEYAKELRDAQQMEILLANKRIMNQLLEAEFGDETGGTTAAEKVALGTALKAMLADNKASTQLNGALAYLQIRKHWRKAEEHKLRMKMQEHLLAKCGAAARTEAGTGKRVVDLETVAKLMQDVDLAA